MNFAKHILAHVLTKLKYFEEQFIFSNSPDLKLFNDISLVCFLWVWSSQRTGH